MNRLGSNTMNDSWDDFVSGIADAGIEGKVVKDRRKVTYTCPQCNGTGLWNGGRVNSHGNHRCWTCAGSGTLKTDPAKLADNRAKRAAKRAETRDAARQQNQEYDDGQLIRWLAANENWNDFARTLLAVHSEGKAWTDNQVAAARRMIAKTEQRRAERAAERAADSMQVDLTPIRTMFETARSNGHKRPVYRAEGLVINRAPDHGRNPGALYVKNTDGEYLGKVVETTYTGRDTARAALALIAQNPLEAAVRYGRKTGTCACCGRELTNALSIELGIGPICRDKWGFA